MSDAPPSSLFAAATNEQDISKAELLEMAAGYSIVDLNLIIRRLSKQRIDTKMRMNKLQFIITLLSDEIRRRAEIMEMATKTWSILKPSSIR